MFTEGRVYRSWNTEGPLTVRDDLGHERVIGSNMCFIVRNDPIIRGGLCIPKYAYFKFRD